MKLSFIKPDRQFQIVADNIIKQYLTVAFWVSFIGWWKIYELIEKLKSFVW